jgi:hypothetical protein
MGTVFIVVVVHLNTLVGDGAAVTGYNREATACVFQTHSGDVVITRIDSVVSEIN